MKPKICSHCGYIGQPIPQAKSSFVIDAFLWMITLSMTAFSGLLPLLLIPLAWTIYHIAKFNTVKCPKCECLEMISMKSRKGKDMLARERGPEPWSDDDKVVSTP